jgi:hypothetical protein
MRERIVFLLVTILQSNYKNNKPIYNTNTPFCDTVNVKEIKIEDRKAMGKVYC